MAETGKEGHVEEKEGVWREVWTGSEGISCLFQGVSILFFSSTRVALYLGWSGSLGGGGLRAGGWGRKGTPRRKKVCGAGRKNAEPESARQVGT